MAPPTRVIVTGAAQGIGRAVALRVAVTGVQVAVWDTQADGVEETAKLCRERGAASRAWQVDVGEAGRTRWSTTPLFSRVRVRSTWSWRNGIASCASI